MKTSRFTSSRGCCFCNALRAAATSGRSCSAARRLFFKDKSQMMQKSRDRRLADLNPRLCESPLEFPQRDIRLLRHQSPDSFLVRGQDMLLVSAEFSRPDRTRLPVKPPNANHRADTYAKLVRGLQNCGTVPRRLYCALTKILRKGLCHVMLASIPVAPLNPIRSETGIPRSPTQPFRETL